MTEPPQIVKFSVFWHEYSNDDISEDFGDEIPPDKGWYVELEPGGIPIGPNHFEAGYATFDEALAAIDKWCEGRGYSRWGNPEFRVRVTRRADA